MTVEQLSRTKPLRPATAAVCRLRVVRAERIGSGFVRVTFEGADDAFDDCFDYLGFDQWFRLFLPTRGDSVLSLPNGDAEGWHARLLGMPDALRPSVRNYTVRDARRIDGRWQADVDFVVHASAGGQVEGVAAAWALRAQPGQTVGLLDQGVIFNHGDADGLLMVAADETGLPAAEGVARSLPPDARALFVLEVAHDDDIRPLQTEADIEVRWAVRRDADALPGRAAFALVRDAVFDDRGYVYAVGEASFVTDTRKFAQAAGVPSEQVDFCAYWRPSRRRAV